MEGRPVQVSSSSLRATLTSTLLVFAVGEVQAQTVDVLDATETTRFSHETSTAQDLFGTAIDVVDDVMVIGVPHEDSGAPASGAVYIFVRNGTNWEQSQRVVPPDPVASSFFGNTVSISGDTIIVGAERDDDAFESQGAAYVFQRQGGNWSVAYKDGQISCQSVILTNR